MVDWCGWRRKPSDEPAAHAPEPAAPVRRRKILPYGVSQNRLRQSAKSLSLPMILTDDVSEADAMITLKGYYRKRPAVVSEAESAGVPPAINSAKAALISAASRLMSSQSAFEYDAVRRVDWR